MQVVNIGTDYVYLDFDGNEGDVWEPDMEELMGIPVNEKVLEACGFKAKESPFSNVFYYGEVFIIKYEDCFRFGCLHGGIESHPIEVVLCFLHQLQNLLWCLCNKELQIDIEKLR